MLARSKLNSIESKISEAQNNEISHEDIMAIINQEKNMENKKKALELKIVKEVLLSAMKLLIIA